MIVIGNHFLIDIKAMQKLAGHPRIFADDKIDRRQHIKRPQRDITQVANRGRDNIKAGRQSNRFKVFHAS